MHNKWTKWFAGLTVMAAMLVGLTAMAGAPVSGAGDPSYPPLIRSYTPGDSTPEASPLLHAKAMPQAATITYDQARARILNNTGRTILSSKGLPVLPFQKPVSAMVKKAMQMAGRPASEIARAESLCNSNIYWIGGPTYRSATNGTAVVWGAGADLYFAAASDPSHYVTAGLGDITFDIKFYGNKVLVFGGYASYIFDVTDPTNPTLVNYLPYVGYFFNYNDVTLTPDGSFALAAYDNSPSIIEAWDLSVPGGRYMGPQSKDVNGNSLEDVTSIIIPSDGNGNGTIAIAADFHSGYINFFDISKLSCGEVPNPIYMIFSPTVFPLPVTDAAYLMYQAPYLYFSWLPKSFYHPLNSPWFVTNIMRIGVLQIPDLTNPANFMVIKGYTKTGDDIVSLQPAGNGNVAIGSLQDHVFLEDAQLTTIVGFGTYGQWDPLFKCPSLMWDMGWSSTYGTVASDARGMQSFDPTSWAQTGQVMTGGYSQSVLQSGNYLLVPSGIGGLVILDNSTGTPTLVGQLPMNCTTGPNWVSMVAVTDDGNTAYVANGHDGYIFVVDITDKAHPTVVNVISPNDGSDFTYMVQSEGELWIATQGSHLEEWDLTVPQSPIYMQSVALSAEAEGKILPLNFAAWPASTLLGVVENGYVDIVDITDTTNPYNGTDGVLNAHIVDGSSYNYALAQNGDFLYLTNDGTNLLYPIHVTPGPSAHPINIAAIAYGTNLTFSDGPYNIVTEYPNTLAVVGDYGSSYGGYGLNQFDVTGATNAMAPVLSPTPQFPFNPTTIGFYDVTPVGSAFAWADDFVGIGMFNVNPDMIAPTVNAPTAAALTPYGRLQGIVTLSTTAFDAQTGVQSLSFYVSSSNATNGWKSGYKVATVASAIPAGPTAVPMSATWNSAHFTDGVGPWYVWAVGTDGGCNTTEAVSAAPTYMLNLPPYDLSWTSTPAPPAGLDPCATTDWIICGDITFVVTATDPANNPAGITQYIAFVDGQQFGLPSNNVPPVAFKIDTTQLSDGPHTFSFEAVDAAGLTTMSKTVTFMVHNLGPSVYVVQPVSGDVVSGPAITLSAHVVPSAGSPGIAKVYFFLDPANPAAPSFASDQIIGIATSQDAETGNWIAGTPWDATSTPYGNHIIVAVAKEVGSPSCPGPGISPLVSFRLIQYTPPTLTATATPTSGNIPLSVAFAANVTNGVAPYTYAWAYGDSNTASGQAVTHTYATAGTYNWTVTVTDGQGNTASANGSITAINPVVPPTISSIQKAGNPFRLVVLGSNFHSAMTASIGGTAWTNVVVKSGSKVVIKGGKSLKALLPKGTPVAITLTNTDDGGTSAVSNFTR